MKIKYFKERQKKKIKQKKESILILCVLEKEIPLTFVASNPPASGTMLGEKGLLSMSSSSQVT